MQFKSDEMALFKGIFKKQADAKPDAAIKHPKGFHELTVASVDRLTAESVRVSFNIPENLQALFKRIPGQHINIAVTLNGAEQRRSYSICSGKNEELAVAIKAIKPGIVSQWANQELKAGDVLLVSPPEGHFSPNPSDKVVVAFAAGSGITPILSIAKEMEQTGGKMHLFYGNKSVQSIMFKDELEKLSTTTVHHYLSQESQLEHNAGRLDKENISAALKADLSLLKADAFFLCGPEDLILQAKEILHLFGVPKEKIHYELFTTPTHIPSEPVAANNFTGTAKVKVILDDEEISFELKADGKTILDAVGGEGYDAPYSCRGGVCCTCRAKVLSGKATMTLNYSLTDQEVADGYILTCQSHPASETLTVSYDV